MPSSSFFSKKIDQMALECRELEDKIREREDMLSHAIATSADMEKEVRMIKDEVTELQEEMNERGSMQNLPLHEQLEAKRRILGKIDAWKKKLDVVKKGHPFASSPDPSPRRASDASEHPVPKLALDQLHETPAIKLAEKAEQMIDEIEILMSSDMHELESRKRGYDVYEEEIAHLSARLADAQHRLKNLPLSGGKGAATPRTMKEELEEYKKLLEEVEGYEREINELKSKRRRLGEGSTGTSPKGRVPAESRLLDSWDETDSRPSPTQHFADTRFPVSESISAVTVERQRTDPESELDSALFEVLEHSPPRTSFTPISPVRPHKAKRELSGLLYKDIKTPSEGSDERPPSASSGSTSSLLDADVLSPPSPMEAKLDAKEAIPRMPLPIDASSPYMVDVPGRRLSRYSDSTESRDELGERVKELLASSPRQESILSQIQQITKQLDECQSRLDTSDHTRSLQEQLDDNQIQILEEEQYCRMVEAYKSELEQVTEWMEDAREVQGRMETGAGTSSHPATIGSLTDDLTTLQDHIKDCEKTVADVERKLRLVTELTDKTLTMSRGDKEGEELLEQLTNVKDELESLQKTAAQNGRQFQDVLESKQDEALEQYQAEVQKMEDWLSAVKSQKPEEKADKGYKKFVDDLQQHQTLLEQVAKLGKTMAAQKLVSPSAASESKPEKRKKDWDKMIKGFQKKSRSTDELFMNLPQTSTPVRRASIGSNASSTKASVDDIKAKLQDLQDCWNELKDQSFESQDAVEKLQEQVQKALEAISQWMDGVESHLSRRSSLESEQQLQQILKTEMGNVQSQMGQLRNVNDNISTAITESEFPTSLKSALQSLNERLNALEREAKQRELELAEKDLDQKEIQSDILFISSEVTDLLDEVTTFAMDEISSLPEANVQVQEMRETAQGCSERIDALETRVQQLGLQPWSSSETDLHQVKQTLEKIRECLEQKGKIIDGINEEEAQFSQMLLDYSEALGTGQQKLQIKRLAVGDLGELKQYLVKFKEYFDGLQCQRALCIEMDGKLHPTVHSLHELTFSELKAKHTTLTNQAVTKQQQLAKVAKQWSDLNEKLEEHRNETSAVDYDLMLGQADEEDVQDLSQNVQDLQLAQKKIVNLDGEIHQISDEVDEVLSSVKCDTLKSKVNEATEKLILLRSKVDQELDRLQAIQQELPRYNELSSGITEWLSEKPKRAVEIVEELEASSSEGTDAKVDEFHAIVQEFHKIKMSQAELKKLVEKLAQVKLRNMDKVKETMDQIENGTNEMEAQLPSLAERLHKAQVSLLPVNQAIAEMAAWIEKTNKQLDQMKQENFEAVTSHAVREQLATYKAYQMELRVKQFTVDFINKASKAADPFSPRQSEVELADRLGKMNMEWEILKARVDNCISQLEPEMAKWAEHEKHIRKSQQWIDDQLQVYQQLPAPGSKSHIQKALLELQGVETKLKKKYSEIRRLEKEYKDLVLNKNERFRAESPEPGYGSPDLAKLSQMWAILEHHLTQGKRNLKKALEQWERFDSAEQPTHKQLDTIEHALMQSANSHSSMDVVSEQLTQLENLEHDLRRHSLQQQLLQVEASSLIPLCDPTTSDDIRKKLNSLDARWNELSASIEEQISKYRKSLEVWQEYENQYQQAESRLYTVMSQSDTINTSQSILDDPQECELKAEELMQTCTELKAAVSNLSSFSDKLGQLMDPSSSLHISAQNSRLEQAVSDATHQLSSTMRTVSTEKSKISDFKEKLGFLEAWLSEAESVLDQGDLSMDEGVIQTRMQELKIQLQAFKTYSASLDELNSLGYQLPLQAAHVSRLKNLNTKWNEISKQTAEKFQHLQALHLRHLNFTEKCESWMLFIAQMESSLTTDTASTYEGLLEQARTLELFTVEMMGRQLILQAIISDGEKLLESGTEEERAEFKSKLDQLSSQWQLVMKRMQQRKFAIDEGIRLWADYNRQKHQFTNWMEATKSHIRELECEKRIHQNVHGIKNDIEKLKLLEKSATTNEGRCTSTLEAGKDVMPVTRDDSSSDLKKELSSLHNDWLALNKTIQEKKRTLQELLSRWNGCGSKVSDMLGWLRETKSVLTSPESADHDEIHSALIKYRDREIMLDMTGDKLRALEINVEELRSEISRADIALLRQRVEMVRHQWEELKSQTQQRKSSIEARLGEWDDFDDKYRELCDWLGEMEQKISQTPDIAIEDLLERLEKEFQEEIASVEDRRSELESLCDKLVRGGKGGRAKEVEYKLDKLNDRWENMKRMNRTRSKKLRETLQAVDQLERSMEDLRSWLKDMEEGLARPVVHQRCDDEDVVERLTEQQALQRDIEKHSSGVSSVLNLCEVLLHDGDACSNETEKDSIEQATNSLDRRWRNICSLSMERKLKIEETQRLWQKFMEDYSRFSDWLRSAELVVMRPNTYFMSYKISREELKRFESFQRQVHESLTQLELINKQYRRLARENRTDATNKLKTLIHDGNSRWDSLSHRVTCILRRLKHGIHRREDFEAQREALLVWLTETDLRLTNVEHFMQSENYDKLKEVKNFQATIEEHIPRILDLDVKGKNLLEKSEETDCVTIEEELLELHRYCREVVSRLDRYHKRLLRIMNEPPPGDSSLFEDTELENMDWWPGYHEEAGSSRNSSPSLHSPPHDRLLVTPRGQTSGKLHASGSGGHSGRATPESLEWDLYDISQSELETKDDGAMTDDDSIPEISPLEMQGDDVPLLHVSHGSAGASSKTTLSPSRRSHDLSVSRELELDDLSSPTAPKKQRTAQDEASQGKIQFINDLTATLAWLDATGKVTDQEKKKSEATDDKSISQLEHDVKELKDLQKSLEQRKAIVLSIRLVASSYAEADVNKKLTQMNIKWESLQQKSIQWSRSLQESLTHSQEFQSTITELSTWVDAQNQRRDDMRATQQKENAESSPTSQMQLLRKDHKALDQIRIESLEATSRVTTMQEICIQLTSPLDGEKAHRFSGTRALTERVRSTNSRLKALLDAVRSDLRDMEHRIKAARRRAREENSSASDSESSDTPLRASTPLRLRMLQRKLRKKS